MESESASERAWCEVSAGYSLRRARAKSLHRCQLHPSYGITPPHRERQTASADAIPRPILVQSELCPQIYSPDLLVRCKAVGSAALENAAVVHDVGTIGNPQGL